MIYITEENKELVEYLLNQAIQGNHLLFDPDTVREAMTSDSFMVSEEETYSVEPHIERLLALPTLMSKRCYLESLSPDTIGKVIRTYFNIVENNLFESQEVRH